MSYRTLLSRLFRLAARRWRHTSTLALLLAVEVLVGAGLPVTGQEAATGRLVDALTGDPVASAMVAVLDGDGIERSRRLSGSQGDFALPLTGPPPYVLLVERIGFRRHELPLDGDGRDLVLRLAVDPVELPGVAVSTEPVCAISSQATSESIGAAWDLVRATLARATLGGTPHATRGEAAVFDVVTYEGEMDLELRFLDVIADTAMLLDAPFAFVDSTELRRTGWSEAMEDRQVRYFAPSPGLLLTPWFRSSHCFALEGATGDTLALRFRSGPEMEGAGIEGAFFLSREAVRVARVEFRHLTGGPPAPHQGGEIVLAEGNDGSWYVEEWWMRTPIFASRPANVRGPLGRVLPRWRDELVGYKVRGGIAGRRRS